jgi:hypothetical protein
MKFALSFVWFVIQFLRLIFSALIVGLGFLLILTKAFWFDIERYPWFDKGIWIGVFGFSILALIAGNKLVKSIQNIKKGSIFNEQNTSTFKFAAIVTSLFLVGKYMLLFYIHSIEKGELALSELWNDSATQLSEVISFGLLACFFWVISKLIEEGIQYKNENDLTI